MSFNADGLRSRSTADSDGIRVRSASTDDDGIRVEPAPEPTPEPAAPPSDESTSSAFECNVCLDTASEPVVTRCGHLFCWPCLHQWLAGHNTCPVCKAGVTTESVIPLYGRGGKNRDPRTTAPPRPRAERVEAPPNPHDQHFPHPFAAFFGGGHQMPANAAGFTAFAGFPGMGVHMQVPLNINNASINFILLGAIVILFLIFLN